jgi:hypothetical protein
MYAEVMLVYRCGVWYVVGRDRYSDGSLSSEAFIATADTIDQAMTNAATVLGRPVALALQVGEP